MMKRTVSAAILVLTVFQMHPAVAAVKAGSACVTANATTTVSGVKYTCTKSGGKLTWKASAKTSATSGSTTGTECTGQVRLGATQNSRPTESVAQYKFDAGTPCSYKYLVKDYEGNLIKTVVVSKFEKGQIAFDLTNLTCDSIQTVTLTAFAKANATGASVTFPAIESAWCGWKNTGPNPTPSPKAEANCEGALRMGVASSERISATEVKFKFDAQYPCSYTYTVKDSSGKVLETAGPFNVRKTYISINLSNLTCETRGTVSLVAYSKPNAAGSLIEFPASDIPWCS
jgi:hypothetical protein